MEQKTHDILLELKNGKDAQTAAWLSHPTGYADLVTSVVDAASGAGQEVSIGNTLASLANTPLYENAETMMFPAAFVSSNPTEVTSYPNYLSNVLQEFALQVTEYAANAAEEQPIIYAPPLPINPTGGISLTSCFATCRWLVSIDAYAGSTYAADIARLNAATNCNSMFSDCASLVRLPETWTFDSLVSANNMFNGCLALANLPSGFASQSISNCGSMFSSCSSLVELPEGFTLANATGTRIFRQCRKLASLPSGFDIGACPSFLQVLYNCVSLRAIPSSLTFKMSRINNAQSSGEYNTDSVNNSMYQMFYLIGFDDYEDETSVCIENEFTIDPTVQGYTGGIKFDIILWHNGFQKLSPESVVSLFGCLHDWWDDVLEDYDYTDRFPNATVAAATTTQQPTIYVTSEIFAQLTAAQKAIAADKGWDLQPYL